MAQLSLGGLGGIVLAPDVLEEQRGAWCSPPEYTKAAGRFDIDPFSNPRSTVESLLACWLERGDDAFGLERRHERGTVWLNKGTPIRSKWTDEPHELAEGRHVLVDENYTCWIQPPYDLVIACLAHFGHTRFTALLRLDTSTVWFQLLYAGITEADLHNPEQLAKLTKALKHTHAISPCAPLCEVVMVPKSDRLEFVPPPGVKASSNPFPHGLYYKRAADVPDAIKALCYPWPTVTYPWGTDPLKLRGSAGASRWRLFVHTMGTRGKPERPIMALHLSRIVGTGTEDAPACGNPIATIAPCDQMHGFALACCDCLAMTEQAA